MIARALHFLSDLVVMTVALHGLRHAPREGLLARVTPAPEVHSVLLPARRSALQGDLYLPARRGRHGAIVLVPGFAELGKDDPRVAWLGGHLARIGFVVLAPDFPGLRALRADEADVQGMVDSFRYLASLGPRVRPDRVGFMAFSYGAGPTLVAAAEPAIAAQVRFVISLGGYYDLVDVIRFVTTGHFAWQDHRGFIPPSRHARGRFLLANLDLLGAEGDREILGGVARALMAGDLDGAKASSDGLTPWGSALYALLLNEDPERVGSLIAALHPRIRERIAFLSPSRVTEQLRAHLVVIHGLEDDFIPYTESLRLAAALRPEGVHLAVTQFLTHVDVMRPRAGGSASWLVCLRELRRIAQVLRFIVAQRR